MRCLRLSPVIALPALVLSSLLAHAGQNPDFTLPMHGIWPATFTETCDTPAAQGVDCSPSGRPTVNLPAGATGPGVVYLFMNNHAAVRGVQTAFEFAPWTMLFGRWDCLAALPETVPSNPGGPRHGLLCFAWPCVTDPSLLVIGSMTMNLTGSGCITQVQPERSTFLALDCNLEIDEFGLPEGAGRLGSVCIGSGGHDACDRVVPVESATWGRIKRSYR